MISKESEPVHPDARGILGRMERELMTSAQVGRDHWAAILSAARATVQRPIGAIVLTGCGDSLYAGLAVRQTLEQLSGVPVVALPAMEAARFPTRLLREQTLLVGISVSGKVERTIEAVSQHREKGGSTLAISAFADSDLAVAAEGVIDTGMRGTPGPVPGTVNYLGSLLGLHALGVALADRRGAPPSGDEDVPEALTALDVLLKAGQGYAADIASRLTPPFFALGSGPDYGSACFGVAKFIEAAATLGVAQDLEEWAHEHYFITGPGRTVVVFAVDPAAVDRAIRVARSARTVGAQVVLLAPRNAELNGEHRIWPIPEVAHAMSPLVSWAPLALTALAYARLASRSPFGLDQPGRMQTADDDIYLNNPRRR